MHITKVVVEGFKSYRDKTVINFLPGLNVIVGLNGSGKSNLFYAIQFVLSQEFYHMPRERRESMLHTSAGHRAVSAYVEIFFNNEERRIPNVGTEVRLRREISSSHDVYTLNQRQILISQLISTLQAAGLSKVNPYFIIKQGKINELAMASDSKRLHLLTEIAGSVVWNEKRPKDVQLLEETNRKIQQLRSFLDQTGDTLKNLEKQKSEYDEWRSLDNRRRTLELLSLRKDDSDLKRKLVDCKARLSDVRTETQTLTQRLLKVKEEEVTQRHTVESMRYEMDAAQERERHLEHVVQEAVARLCQLEMRIEDGNVNTEQNDGEIAAKEAELQAIEEEIVTRRAELEVLLVDYGEATNKEFELNTKLLMQEERQLQMLGQRDRQTQFASREERDRWIHAEKVKLQQLVASEEHQLNELRRETEAAQVARTELEGKIEALETENQAATLSFVDANNDKKKLDSQFRRLEGQRRDLWSEENDILQRLRCAKDEANRASKALCRVVPHAIVKGWESVAWALQQMRQSEDESVRRLADGYRGLVAELMTCDGGLFAAVDSVAGNRLFHHVVDSDRVASELVRRVNAGRLDGTVHFLPLNRLQRRTVDVPLLPVAQPMISELHTQPDMAVVLENIFGRTLICEDVAAAQKVARQYKLDCVTLDGDLVRNNGPIRGGFLAGDRLRLPLFASLSKFKDVASQEQAALDQLRLRLADTSRRIDETAHELQRTETKIARLKFDQLRASLASARQELDLLQQSLRAKQDLCRRIRISKKSNCSKIAALDQELTQNESPLSAEESDEQQRLSGEIEALKNSFEQASACRQALESRRNELESRLNDYLVNMRDELKRAIQSLQWTLAAPGAATPSHAPPDSQLLTELDGEKRRLREQLDADNAELEQVRAKVAQYASDLDRCRLEYDRLKGQRRAQETAIRQQHDVVSRLMQSISRYETESAHLAGKSNQYADVADDQLAVHDRLTRPRIERELQQVRSRLKELDNAGINQKAELEYTFYVEKRKELTDKCQQAEGNQNECWELMANVDMQKDDALQHTFSTVARHFRTIFRTLVPHGRAHLRWNYGSDSDVDDADNDNDAPPDVARLSGVDIVVSFSGDDVSQLSCLSGGQRSLVSLALVFSLQMLDRAPFYLLDEADMGFVSPMVGGGEFQLEQFIQVMEFLRVVGQALDQPHRASVAALIDTFAKSSQFIATTFRPELLPYAVRIVGVSYLETQTSRARCVNAEEADEFIRQDSQSLDDTSQSTLS